MKQFRKFVSGALTLATSLTLSGIGMVGSAYAAPLYAMSTTLGTSEGSTSTTYTIAFSTKSADTLKGIKLTFANRASGSVTKPSNWDGTSATLTSVTKDGTPETANWTLNTTVAGTGYLYLINTTGSAVVDGSDIVVTLSGIVNNDSTISGGIECDSVANSDSCFVRTETHTEDTIAEMDSGTYLEDSGVMTYTVVTPVTVTATVDPSLRFTLSGVTNTDIATNDTNASCANVVTSTATTIPFGNLGVGIAANRCGQHSLSVATNASGGYNVYLKFIGASATANLMQGSVNTANNIDPFANAGATFGSPQLFNVDPSGTVPSTNSGWLGIRSTDIGGFAGSNLYGPPAVNNTTTLGDVVMTNNGPDLGTGSNIKYVTFKIAVNALQPADVYTGEAQYDVVASY